MPEQTAVTSTWPERIDGAEQLEEVLSRPAPAVVELMARLEGDIVVLGAGGKMGASLLRQARRACDQAGSGRRLIAVSRFGDAAVRAALEQDGITTVACDLLDPAAVAELPDSANVIYLAGRKFGTVGAEVATWAANVIAPQRVCDRYRGSRIAAFSTGCVYPLRTAAEGGCDEAVTPAPVGEYAQSCLGRERVFQHAAEADGTPVCLLRLNYAVEPRYGVLHDIATQVVAGAPIDAAIAGANAIWQGDANAQALLALEHCAAPAAVLNITGPETVTVAALARRMAARLGVALELVDEAAGAAAYLSDAARATALFGPPRVPLEQVADWTIDWVAAGHGGLGKPTCFQVRDGRF